MVLQPLFEKLFAAKAFELFEQMKEYKLTVEPCTGRDRGFVGVPFFFRMVGHLDEQKRLYFGFLLTLFVYVVPA